MDSFAMVLAGLGFASFAAAVAYELINRQRKGGPVFEGRKAIVFPWILISFAIFMVGFVILASSRW
jgi:tellurite resistance protein TehA-like permease